MTDMPVLMAEVVADLHKEHEAEFQALVIPDKQLTGAVSRVLSPIYRQLLAV